MLAWLPATLLLALWAGAVLTLAQSTSNPSLDYGTTLQNIDGTPTNRIVLDQKEANCSENKDFPDLKCIDKNLKQSNSSLIQFLVVAAFSMFWIFYITFFNSRVIGYILTKILNQFVKDGHLKIGSFSISVLSGKIMFRDVQYITTDSSILMYDGYCIFRWWRPYKFSPWRKKTDLSEGHTRLTVHISGLEYHVYNRSDVYGRLEELFELDSKVFVSKSKASKHSSKKSETKESQKIALWRSLIPVIKISVSYGKVIFGNRLLSSTLVISYEDAKTQYKTTKASNKYDLFMHVLDGTLGSVKVMLIPSPKYDPAVLPPNQQVFGDDPMPRMMSEGYDLINSSNVSFKYMWDELGKTGMPLAQSKFAAYEAKSNDADFDDDNAVWELEVRCENRVVMNYGPWADRQINYLWKFYYPLDYQKQEVTPASKHGEIRTAPIMNVYINLLQDSEITLLYLKHNDTNAIHISVMKGSCVEIHVPMTVAEDGFTTHVSGQLIYPDATTSMPFRPLLNAEILSFSLTANYPLAWNGQQTWNCDIKATKASVSLLFQHKNFIADLMDDWADRAPADLLTFFPYRMKFSFDLQDFELILPANEYNWLDCAPKKKENALVALTGKSLNIDFTLPFDAFLAPTYTMPVVFRVMRGELCLFVPESNPSRHLLLNLSNGMEAWNTGAGKTKENNSFNVGDIGRKSGSARSSAEVQDTGTYVVNNDGKNSYENSHRLRKDPNWGSINHDWVKCWDAPEMALTISYTWHPILPAHEEDHKRSRDSDLNKEIERVDKAIQRLTKSGKKASFKKVSSATDSNTDIADSTPLLDGSESSSSQRRGKAKATVMFDPTSLDPDEMRVDFTLKPGSTLYLYGSLLHHFLAVKENYLGVDDSPTDFANGQQKSMPKPSEQHSNPLYYRTLQVTVNVNLHKVRGILPVHMNPSFGSCPVVKLKLLSFEMDKNYLQTRLQLLLSKLAIEVEENVPCNGNFFDDRKAARKGWLMLTDLQLRGHAMFSGAGLPLGAVTVEYGWLTEVLVGPVTGSLTVPQIRLLAQWAEMFIFLLKNSLYELKPAFPERYLPTAMSWNGKKMDRKPITEEDVKFLMAQIKLEAVRLRVMEGDSALDVVVSPVLISNGNVQFPGVKEAALIRVREVLVKQRIRKPTNYMELVSHEEAAWVEAGEVRLGSLHTTITVATPEREMCTRQTKFLRFHDKKTRRLHFLWQDSVMNGTEFGGDTALSTVQALKSWGCNFFTPLTSKHPTYFYKSRKTPPRKLMSQHDGRSPITEEDGSGPSSSSKEEDSSDRDSDVFDPYMEYGMSLLTEGKCLLSRSRTISSLSKKSSDSTDSAARKAKDFPVKDELRAAVLAGHILMAGQSREAHFTKRRSSRPGLKRQDNMTSSTGHINVSSPLATRKSQNVSPSMQSAIRRPRSATVGPPLKSSGAQPLSQQQVSFAPSPEKISALKRSSSQTDMDVVGSDASKQAMKRALSSESNLYRSAESDFKSTTSVSSDVGEEFYSAESDIEESKPNDMIPDSSIVTPPLSVEEKKTSLPRPGTLVLENEMAGTVSTFSTTASIDAQASSVPTPSVTRSLSMSPGSSNSADHSSTTAAKLLSPLPQAQCETVLACYESHLTLLCLKPAKLVPKKVPEAEEEDSWFDEDLYVLPNFAVLRDGIHPSVMVDRELPEHGDRRSNKTESANRELSFDEIDSSGKSTNVSVHLRESLDVQLTPFLLKTIGDIVDATTPMVKHENPLVVVSRLEMECQNDAEERLPEEDDKEKLNNQDKSKVTEKVDKQRPSLRRQKRTEGSEGSPSNENKMKSTSVGPTVTRPPPGTKLSVLIDKVRINVLQATLGDDKIFSLRSSKLLPTPCVTVLATRLESLNVSVDLNSRRKNRLLMENLRRVSSSTSTVSDRRQSLSNSTDIKKASTSSDVTYHKHFLVLLNAKATAKSVALQLRAMTCDGSIPDMTSITALADKDHKAPFRFDPALGTLVAKEMLDKWNARNENGSAKQKISRYQAVGPPKLWGWVMLEAGVDRVRVNVIKQVPVKGTKDVASIVVSETQSSSTAPNEESGGDRNGVSATSGFEESARVHFLDDASNSTNDTFSGADNEWAIQDTNLHASQGELFIGSVWINVPAPSAGNVSSGRALRSWNLLSCLSASITCWLAPADRLATSVTNCAEEKLTRVCAATACVLTEAHERQQEMMKPAEMKYHMLTAKANHLRTDANLLLCHELQRFLRTPDGRQMVFAAVGPTDGTKHSTPALPALFTLKKGLSAVLRQWTSKCCGAIGSAKVNHSGKSSPKKLDGLDRRNEAALSDLKRNSLIKELAASRSSLVVEVEVPEQTVKLHLSGVETDAVPMRQPKPVVVKKSETFTSLSAIEEIVSSGSGVHTAEKAQPTGAGTAAMADSRPAKNPSISHATPTEDLVYQQQRSMYSWMSNATKPSPQAKTSLDPNGADVESQNLDPNEVFIVERMDITNSPRASPGSPREKLRSEAKVEEANLSETMNFEEVFQIFLRNVGIDVDSSVPIKSNVSFIRGECLGSLSVSAKLALLRVDKQEADPLYNIDGRARRKRRSSKTRKPRSYYNSLEHARELREPYMPNTSTWPHVYPHQVAAASPPILNCQDVGVKSSIIEMEVGGKDCKKGQDMAAQGMTPTPFLKKRTTLKVGAQLSVDNIVQHVDIALVRLIHQITQISDNVQQAKTDIQVNKYTEGSVSPDFKVIHRRTISNVSEATNVSATAKRRSSQGGHSVQGSVQSLLGAVGGTGNVEETDALSNASASTASTEVPHCWQAMYKMVDLYDTIPERKTEAVEKSPMDTVHMENENFVTGMELNSVGSVLRRAALSMPQHDPYLSLVLKATAMVKKVEMHAAVGDLKLNAEIVELLTKVDHTKEAVNAYKKEAASKFNTTLHDISIRLLDQAGKPLSKTIAVASVQQSSLDASTNHQRESQDNVVSLHLGVISFDLSQHPASLQDVVSRGSRQLSAHISEFVQTPTVKQSYHFDQPDGSATPSYLPTTPAPSSTALPPLTPVTPSTLTALIDLSQDSSSQFTTPSVNVRFVLKSDGIAVVVSLLPSLHAEYKTGPIEGEGCTGLDATFSVCLLSHTLRFTTTNCGYDLHLERPSMSEIQLPEINVYGEYKQSESDGSKPTLEKWKSSENYSQKSDGTTKVQLRSGEYLSVGVEIGSFEHCLTTDLLNQLIFLQEVFLTEVNEMIEKVQKTNKPVPFWSETTLKSDEASAGGRMLLYQLKLTLKGIQITAVTPSCNAVRLKTGEMMFELSNRVIQEKTTKKKKKGLNVPKYLKMFGKAHVDLTLSLGMLIRHSVYPEAEDEFQQLAYFTTRIGLQNTRQGKDDQARGHSSATNFGIASSGTDGANRFRSGSSHSIDDRLLNPQTNVPTEETDNSVVLISLTRPLFFIQPTAFDKAILVYLSYKTAYEDWKEQQKTVLKAAKQVRDVFQSTRSRPTSTTSLPKAAPQRSSTVFLQLSVNDLGICLPVAQTVQLHEVTHRDEVPSALVLTIDNTLISAYYSRSLVTKGQMKDFCLRFADDFQTSWDDWKYNPSEGATDASTPSRIMNALVVPEGTYEICSDTTTHQAQSSGPPIAKTTVSVALRMMGMDVHFDTKVGSYFSRLTDTLMAITGADEQNYVGELDMQTSLSDEDKPLGDMVDGEEVLTQKRSRSATATSTASSQGLPLEAHHERTRKIEHELNEQVKVVNDLRQLGAKKSVIEEEERRTQELENALSSHFRQLVKSRLRRSSIKKSRKESPVKKSRPSHTRTKSTTITSTSEIPPRASRSAYATLPSVSHGEDEWDRPVRDAYSADTAGRRPGYASELLPDQRLSSPFTYGSDHVFPPTPESFPSDKRSENTDEDSSFEEDEVDASVPHHLNALPTRRALYADQYNVGGHVPISSMPQVATSVPEAELQLELEVKAVVEGGKIECHPIPQEIDISVRPDYGMMPRTYAASKSRNLAKNTTVFYIPALDVRVQYNSATTGLVPTLSEKTKEPIFSFPGKTMETVTEQSEGSEYAVPPDTQDEDPAARAPPIPVPNIEITTPSYFSKKAENQPGGAKSTTESKRACVHAWLKLQSLPEMVISPYLLDFLEQTLNEVAELNTPVQSFAQKHSGSSSRQDSFHESFAYSDDEASDLNADQQEKSVPEGSVLSSESHLVSLPLDVVVAVNVQPSQVRFNCIPMSRVECMLQIPSIDLAFSSIQEDIDESALTGQEDGNDKKSQRGLSFSAVLSDFSVYVFHPYQGSQPTSNVFPLDVTTSFVGSPSSSADSPFAKSGSGRRDSLSVNLEFVKINLVRKRTGDAVLVAEFASPGSVRGRMDNVIVHVSGMLDIGKAAFKYDMRRLNEILAFPSAWYRRSIARRLFLGDTSEQTMPSPHVNRRVPKQDRLNVKATGARPHAHSAIGDSSILSFLTVDSPLSPQQRPSITRSSAHSDRDEAGGFDGGSLGSSIPTSWHALVLLKMNMSHLDVEMNMSGVMGHTVWSCDALHSAGKLMFHSSGDRDISLSCGLDNSQITARGGIIVGNIELKEFDADCQLLDPADGEPLHKLGMRAQSLDGKIDYMGSCVMMGQLTLVDFQLKDEWRDPVQSIPSSMDKGTVFVHCDLGWRVFQLAISRSSTPDVIKMLSKLEEFFSQQLHSSVRAISSWTQAHARPVSPKKSRLPIAPESSQATEYDHRRHWPPVFKAVLAAIADSESLGSRKTLQNKSFVLGGSACLHGEGLTVVCFHGANFRSRSWVLFNILQPNIVFSTEVQEIKESITGDETSTLAIQSLTVNLGHDVWLSRAQKATDPMATVSRVTRSRNQNPPPSSATIAEWFAYMTASRNEELKMLRTLNDLGAVNSGNLSDVAKTASPQLGRTAESSSGSGAVAYNHEADIIFALPKVQLDFKTEHIQAPNEPDPNDTDNRPVVECSFVTEFTDHICVTMDVELLLFLHDLITSYLKEKQQALSSRTKLSSLNVGHWSDGSYAESSTTPNPLPVDPIDLREFICKTWQLEPTVTLISWAGRRIEPVGVDYILQKLGFQHARTTIPKWIQRGVLDLLDKGLAAIVEQLVVAIINDQKKKSGG